MQLNARLMTPKLKHDQARLSLGIFAADFGALNAEARDVESWGGELLHFDVMDGVFVPTLTGGAGFVAGHSDDLSMDVHLMVQRPADQVEDFVKAGADILTIHIESDEPEKALNTARMTARALGKDILVGYALMPGTDLALLDALLETRPDIILVLALDPRTGGQVDVSAACARVRRLKELHPSVLVEFDGGVTMDTVAEIAASGADLIVSGSAIFKAQDRLAAFKEMNAIVAQPRPKM